ncbi:MAG: hypothetical protein NC084_11060 [Bacteroides sp.]|nr:hypothetical protein [Eubacterium sp.]MCM1419146.1 hypothetical protein [Roseburia sp.]MCM1463233.1 hypothetical protein [Bacteroides sp.]
MNKNEFYKELMSRYALDEDKIRLNALRQAKKPAWQRFAADYWKPALGTAAAVAVTVAAVGYTSSISSEPPAVVPSDSALSASRRLIEAEQNYYNLQADATAPFTDVYMTFFEPVSYGEMVMAFSTVADAGEIRVDALYMRDETILRDEAVREYGAASATARTVVAAKVSAPSALYRDLQDLPQVYLAELASAEINDDTFAPLPIEDPDPLASDLPFDEPTTTTAPIVTTTPFSFDSTPPTTEGDLPAPVIGASGVDQPSTLTPPAETGLPVTSDEPGYDDPEETEPEYDDPEETEETRGSAESTTTEPEYDDPDETEETTVTTVAPPENEIGSAVTEVESSLLTELYELNVPNSLETLLSGNNAVVLTKNEVYLYTLGGFGDSRRCAGIELNSPKIAYNDEHTVVLTGTNAADVRNMIAVVDLDRDDAKLYDVSANIGDARLGGISYSPAKGLYYIKSVLDASSFVYEVSVSLDTGLSFRPLVESDGPVSVAGVKGDLLYLVKTEQGTENTKLFSFNCTDGAIVELASFGSTAKLKRGGDLESFGLVTADGVGFIYDVNLGMLISNIDLDESAEIVTESGRTYFQSGGSVYEIDASSSVNRTWRTIAFTKEAVSDYAVSEVTAEKIVVIRKEFTTWVG